MSSSVMNMDWNNRIEQPMARECAPLLTKKGFFDFQKPGWKLVILDLAIGIPVSLVLSFTVKCLFRLIFAISLYYHAAGCLAGGGCSDGGADGDGNGNVGINSSATLGEEAWQQWERLLCGSVFAIANSVLVLVWALQIEEMGVAKMSKVERVRRLKEEGRAWEGEVHRLEGILKAVNPGKSLSPHMHRFKQATSTGTNIDNKNSVEARIRAHFADLSYSQVLEEQRRRSGGVAPESIPATPMLGGEDNGGFGDAAMG